MYRNLLYLFTCVLMLPSCSGSAPHISIVCEENNVGNSIVKWEISPRMEGNVKVYASTNPNHIPQEMPVAMANIADQRMTIVSTDPAKRYYYSLVFNDKYRVKIATRNVNIAGIQNFRDLGGYPSYPTKKSVRWGMLYRSAQIDSLDCYSTRKLKNVGIKTIIDLRSHAELKGIKPLQSGFNVIHIPIETGNMENLLNDIQKGKVKTDTIYRTVEQMNRDLVKLYHKEYKQLFDVLLCPDNYPAVIHCSSGKGRTGIATALVLAALHINADIIMEDYRLSNDYFNIPKASIYAHHLPARSQEAITTIYSAREDFLNAAKEELERTYIDVDTYLNKALGLSKDDIKNLQRILLESEE